MKIILVRHGKEDDRYRGGWSSHDLTPQGVSQAMQLAAHLKENQINYNITRILSSDLPRALTTANYIAGELELPVQKEPQLREINNGDLAGMLNAAALEQYPGLFFSSLEMDEPYPNGESPMDFYLRIQKWFSVFCDECNATDDNILIVSHGGVINVIYHLVNRKEWSNKGPSYKAANCSLHILDLAAMKFETENKTDFLSS